MLKQTNRPILRYRDFDCCGKHYCFISEGQKKHTHNFLWAGCFCFNLKIWLDLGVWFVGKKI